MASNIPITAGSGTASVASEQIGNNQYQIIKMVGGETGSTSVLGVNPDRSINVSVIGTHPVTIGGSVATVIIGGSIAASFTPPANQSVSGTVGASIIGLPPFVLGGSTNASVITVGAAAANQSVSGAINVSGSVLLGSSNASVIAYIQNSSILAVPIGSIITVFQNSSLLSVPTGSVITVLQAASIVGTYAEDAASASGDKGFLVMGARNDTLASVTSNDGDYSSHVVGPAGELIAENAPLTKWVSGTASMLGGVSLTTSVQVIAAQGASIFTYITGVQVANLGSASVLVGFYGGTSSLIAYTIAPAGGGSNVYFQNGIKTTQNGAFFASVSGTASIFVSAQGFISKT